MRLKQTSKSEDDRSEGFWREMEWEVLVEG